MDPGREDVLVRRRQHRLVGISSVAPDEHQIRQQPGPDRTEAVLEAQRVGAVARGHAPQRFAGCRHAGVLRHPSRALDLLAHVERSARRPVGRQGDPHALFQRTGDVDGLAVKREIRAGRPHERHVRRPHHRVVVPVSGHPVHHGVAPVTPLHARQVARHLGPGRAARPPAFADMRDVGHERRACAGCPREPMRRAAGAFIPQVLDHVEREREGRYVRLRLVERCVAGSLAAIDVADHAGHAARACDRGRAGEQMSKLHRDENRG